MADPGFYPDRPDRVDVRETHVSWVFLAGDRAFKLRKQVVFPFLDYGTPERRHHMAEEEVRLGRRLAPSSTAASARWCLAASGYALAGGAIPTLVNTWWRRSGSTSRARWPPGCAPARSRRRTCGVWPANRGISRDGRHGPARELRRPPRWRPR